MSASATWGSILMWWAALLWWCQWKLCFKRLVLSCVLWFSSTDLLLSLCKCVSCMCSWGVKEAHVHMCVGLCKDRKLTLGVSLSQFSTLCFERVSYWAWSSVIALTSKPGGLFLPQYPCCWDYKWITSFPGFYMGAGDPNSDLGEPSLQSGVIFHCVFLFILKNLKGLSFLHCCS